jgi:hypothetical protein
MTSAVRYLLNTNSALEACSDQESLRKLLTDLRAVAEDLELNLALARLEAETRFVPGDSSQSGPVI